MNIQTTIAMERMRRRANERPRHYALALARFAVVLAFATLCSIIAQQTDHPATAALILMVAIIVNGASGGLAPGIITGLVAAFFYNFFIRFPVFQFGWSSVDDYVPLFAFTMAAAVSGALSGRLKDRAQAAEQAGNQLDLMLNFSARLQRAIRIEDIVQALRRAASDESVRAHILSHLEERHAALLSPKWHEAIAAACPCEADAARTALLAPEVDTEAVADLLAMAIERCDLLQQRAEAEAIRRSEELKTTLLSSLSHDLRTPIAAIAAAASGLGQYGALMDGDTRAELLETIRLQCDRLDRFTGRLLSLGQLQHGISAEQMEIVDVADALGSVIGQLRKIQPERSITNDARAGSVLVWANPVMLEQVLFNVLENAINYTPVETPISVTVAAAGGFAEICVTDRGPGIPPNALPRIFERFFRSMDCPGKPGQGLGLSIAKGFAEAFGGSISAVSPVAEGHGTQVRIALPLAKDPITHE